VIDAITRTLLRILRVPEEPHLPAGEPGSARVFRAGLNYWRLRVFQWVARQVVTVAGFVFLMVMLQTVPETITFKNKNKGKARSVSMATMISWVRGLEVLAWGLWVVQLPLTFAVIRLDYELRWYIVTDRSARLREGVLSMTEMTFTLANVQDIRILQGPLQRLLGLADVELRTAGGGDTSPASGGHGLAQNLHLARFRGVDNAEVIRDLVLDRMKKARGAGLGDPDDQHAADAPVRTAVPASLEEAARDLAVASAALREAVRSR
jgi:uncharacterized membrane protein YdbT with pleckstrin-like domain